MGCNMLAMVLGGPLYAPTGSSSLLSQDGQQVALARRDRDTTQRHMVDPYTLRRGAGAARLSKHPPSDTGGPSANPRRCGHAGHG